LLVTLLRSKPTGNSIRKNWKGLNLRHMTEFSDTPPYDFCSICLTYKVAFTEYTQTFKSGRTD
jgi:hypothetical protein